MLLLPLLSQQLWLLQPMQGINGLLRQLLWWLQMEVAKLGSLSKTVCADVSLQLMSVHRLLMLLVVVMGVQWLLLL